MVLGGQGTELEVEIFEVSTYIEKFRVAFQVCPPGSI
jgi:hypothetical protein